MVYILQINQPSSFTIQGFDHFDPILFVLHLSSPSFFIIPLCMHDYAISPQNHAWFAVISGSSLGDMAATNINSGRHIFPNGTVWVCEPLSKFQRTKGIFFGENPLNFTMSLFLLQTSVAGFLTSFLQFLLIPLGESSFFPHMLVIIIYYICEILFMLHHGLSCEFATTIACCIES